MKVDYILFNIQWLLFLATSELVRNIVLQIIEAFHGNHG